MSEDRNLWCGKQVHTGLVPRGRGGVVVRVKCAVRGVGGVEIVNTRGRCGAIFLFLAVSFLSACVAGVSRLCLRSGCPLC
jgi:hypothetical protein